MQSRPILQLMQSALDTELHGLPEILSQPESVITAPRILLADDNEEMLRAVVLVLGNEFNIVGTAEDGKHAVELATQLAPDVVILDISMPIVNGIEAALRLKELDSHAKIVFLTVHTDPDFVEAAQSANALGYVLKECLAVDLAPAIRTAMQGNTFTSPYVQLRATDSSVPH